MTTLIDSDVRRIGMRQRNSLLPRPMSARGFLLTVLLLVLALFAGTVALPHNPYIRYQMLRNTLHERAQWIYERTHFDPTPIDIIVVGPSRSASAIDAPLLSQLLSDRLGRPIHTVNLTTHSPQISRCSGSSPWAAGRYHQVRFCPTATLKTAS